MYNFLSPLFMMNLPQVQKNVDEFMRDYRDGYPSTGNILQKIREERKEIKDALKGYAKISSQSRMNELILEVGDEAFYFICLANSLHIHLDENLDIVLPHENLSKAGLSPRDFTSIFTLLSSVKETRKRIKHIVDGKIDANQQYDTNEKIQEDIEHALFCLSTLGDILNVSLSKCLEKTIDKKVAQAGVKIALGYY